MELLRLSEAQKISLNGWDIVKYFETEQEVLEFIQKDLLTTSKGFISENTLTKKIWSDPRLHLWREQKTEEILPKTFQINPYIELKKQNKISTEWLTSTLPICILRANTQDTKNKIIEYEEAEGNFMVETTAHGGLGHLTISDLDVLYCLANVALKKRSDNKGRIPRAFSFYANDILKALGKSKAGENYRSLKESLERLHTCSFKVSQINPVALINGKEASKVDLIHMKFLETTLGAEFQNKKTGMFKVVFSKAFLDTLDFHISNNLFQISKTWLTNNSALMRRIWQYLNVKKHPKKPFKKKESEWIKYLMVTNEPRKIRSQIKTYISKNGANFPYCFNAYKNRNREWIWEFHDWDLALEKEINESEGY